MNHIKKKVYFCSNPIIRWYELILKLKENKNQCRDNDSRTIENQDKKIAPAPASFRSDEVSLNI